MNSRLFRKYFSLIGSLVVVFLLTAGLLESFLTYHDSRIALAALSQEKARAAASRIGEYMQEVADQIAWVTQPQRAVGGEALLQRRFEYRNLLRRVPAITDIRQLDHAGREQLFVSRIDPDAVATGMDFSSDPRFIAARNGRSYYGPIYFRKGTEPYVSLAVPGERGVAVVAIAEVNLKFIWDVVSQFAVGNTGYAYVVDSSGRLVAHRDLGLVLRNTDLSRLAHVQAVLAGSARNSDALVAHSASGEEVFTASAPIAALGWTVFVEEPTRDAFAPLYAIVLRTFLLLLAGLGLAVLGSLVLAQRMSTPIRALESGARRLGEGALDHRVSVHTGDELEALAGQFNSMAEKLRGSYAELEHKVEERTRDLALANQAKSRFLAAASHDLRQPMHALGLFVTQLRSKPLLAEQRRLVDRIDASVLALGALLDSLLDISRLDAGAVSPEIIDFPVNNVLDRMEDEFMQPAQEKGLRFRVVPSRMWVTSDPLLLERIVTNLVSNALRYTRRGGIVVGCRRRGATLRILVCDTGRGIPGDEQQRIFTEFYQVAHPERNRSQGLGLGLAIVDRLARLLGHRVEVRSKTNKGSTFIVTLRRGTPCETTQPARAVETGIPRGTLVALIDNDALVRDSMSGLLSDWGCDVVAAASAAEAVHGLAARNRPPALVISNYRLRDGSTGVQAIGQLRAAYAADLPAFLISGDTSREVLREAETERLHLLTKPVAPLKLRALLSQMLKAGSVPQIQSVS